MIKLDLKPADSQLKQFAFIAVVGLPLIAMIVLKFCGYGWDWAHWSHTAVVITLSVGILQLLAFLVGFKPLTHVIFVVLMIVALPIGFVLSHVLMAAIYYFVMTPIGLIFRLIGRDAMGRKPDPKMRSYWHDRGPQRSPASYFKLY